MASFTDQLVAFNPYIQQIPVDDYVRVGMIKQQQYNAGVEKVQGYIDSVAGLEVIKPEQKDYLSQRVNNLQQEVGKVVQADFSNQQLVNSVGALTSKIASDPIVQTAVASTQNYKQGLAYMREAREKGKSSVSNEWDFNNQFQKWYNDKDATTRFSGSYTPYTDVTSKISKIIKDLDPNSHIEDNPFKRDLRGNIEIGTDGRPVIDIAMIEKGSKTLTPERIQSAINANLTADDVNQLTIDGRYAYRGMDAQGMKSVTDNRYTHKLDQTNDILQGLMVARLGANNNPQEAARIDQQIQNYKDKASQLQERYKHDISSINNNLEGYKGSFYSNDWLTNFGDSYAYAQESLTYKENPYFMGAERRRENDIKFQEFMVNKQFEAAKIGIEEARLGLEREKLEAYKLSLQAKAAKGKGALGEIPLSDPILEPIQQADLDKVNVENFLQETQAVSDEIDNQKMSMLAQTTPFVIMKKDPDGKNPRYEYNVQGKNADAVIKAANAAVGKLKDAYDKDPNSVEPGVKTYFDNLANADQVIQNRKFAVGQLKDQAARDGWSTKAITDRIAPLRVGTSNGQTFSMTGEEQYEFNSKIAKLSVSVPTYGGPGPSIFLDDAKASKLLSTPAEKYMYNIVKKNMNGDPLSPAEKGVISKLANVKRTANLAAMNIQRGQNEYMDNAIKSISSVQQPVSFTLQAFEAPDRKRAQAVASRLVNTIIDEDKESPNPRYNKSDIESMLGKASDNTTYSLVSKGRNKYALALSNTEITGKPIEMDISRQQAEDLFGQGKFLDDFYNIRQSLELTKGTGKWTTDVRGIGKGSAFNLQSGLLNKYNIKYHVEDPLKNGGLQVKMYIYDKQAKQWLPDRTANFGQLLNEAQVTKFLSNVGDQYIDAMLQSNQ